ncbi:MAG TPA: TraR/DksA family transcriptional regulator, partial [Gemmataceae bacterium]|nr:TraR/DksA family transcriptional regulator [Gemmataceae bacterium]
MTAAELNRYREKLLALGRRLRGEDEEVSAEALRPSGALAEGSTINAPGDAADVSVDSSTQDVSLGLMANERQLLAQVTAALQRIEQGTYGKCVVCGQEIGRERLNALPYTPFCLEHARQLEGRTNPFSTEGTAGV